MTITDEMIWFMTDGRELTGKDVFDHLSSKIPVLLQVLDSAEILDQQIRSELDHCEEAGNIISDTMDLCESLSHIEIYCELFLNEYHQMKSVLDLI